MSSSPLHDAARIGDVEAMTALLAQGADKNERDEHGNLPLHHAAAGASPARAVEVLLQADAEVDALNNERETPLMAFVKASPLPPTPVDTHAMSLLIGKGTDVNALDADGFSPLLLAAHEGKSPLLARMLSPDANADLGATRNGKSLFEMARARTERQLLREHPASPLSCMSGKLEAAIGSRTGLGVEEQADASRLVVQRAVMAAPDGSCAACTLDLGSAALPHAMRRLGRGGGNEPPFATLPPADGLLHDTVAVDIADALAAVSLEPGAAAPAALPPAPVSVVDLVLRELLRTPPNSWQPPPDRRAFFLTADQVLHLCDLAEAWLKRERTVVRVRAPAKLFGDTHGQLGDLLRLFTAYGAPSHDGDIFATDYVFIGDFVDRGHHQLELVCLLLALKVAHPRAVHLLRGNHEIQGINSMYGFMAHCRERLGIPAARRVFERVNDVFLQLPLAALVETPPPFEPDALPGMQAPPNARRPIRVFCVHGGPGRLQRIEDLDALDRAAVRLDEPQSQDKPPDVRQARLLVEDALWSDPARADDDAEVASAPGGVVDNSSRGGGVVFSPAVLRDFCERNDIAAVVRAHQVPRDGVELFAGGRGVTVFSAANYPEGAADYEREGNAAAMLWMGRDGRLYPRLIPPLTTPKAPPPPPAPATE